MARLHNSRIQNTKNKREKQEFVRPTIRQIKEAIKTTDKKTKIPRDLKIG